MQQLLEVNSNRSKTAIKLNCNPFMWKGCLSYDWNDLLTIVVVNVS